MRILALDTATRTGFATNCAGGVESGVMDFSLRRGESAGMRYVRFREWLNAMLASLKPELVAYEMPGGHFLSGSAAEVAYSLVSRVQECCQVAGVDYVGVNPRTLKRYATGRGNADKAAMIQAARERFERHDLTDDNEADSLLILDWVFAGRPEQEQKPKRRKAKT